MVVKKLSAALLALVLAAPCTVPVVCLADTDVPAAEAAQKDSGSTEIQHTQAESQDQSGQPETGGQDAEPVSDDDAKADDSAVGQSDGLKVAVKTYKKEFKTAQGVVYKEISFEYPVAEGDSDAAKAFNKFYRNLRLKWIKAAKEDLQEAKEIVSSRELEDGLHYGDGVTCEITSNDKDYICVLQTGYLYQMGAHGMPYRYSYIFDVKTGKKVSAANLLGITKNQLNKKVRGLYLKKYDKTEKDGNNLFYGKRAEVEKAVSKVDFNKNYYYLKNGKLRFYVDPYVAGPYASGFIETAVKLP